MRRVIGLVAVLFAATWMWGAAPAAAQTVAEQDALLGSAAKAALGLEASRALVACEASSGRGLAGRQRRAMRAGAKVLCDPLLRSALALAATDPGLGSVPADLARLPKVDPVRPRALSNRRAGCRARDKRCANLVKAFGLYARATADRAALLEARAVSAGRRAAAVQAGRADDAELHFGAVKALSDALVAAEAVRAKAARTLAQRIRQAKGSAKLGKSKIRAAAKRLAGGRGRGGRLAAELAGRTAAPPLARRALAAVPRSKSLDLRGLLSRSSPTALDARVAEHLRIGELRRMVEALAAAGQLPASARTALAGELDRAACAATVAERALAANAFLALLERDVRAGIARTLLGAARQLTTYREGLHDPIAACSAGGPGAAVNLGVSPAAAERFTDESHVLTLTTTQAAAGSPPAPNRVVRWTVTGPHPSSGIVTTGSDGTATVTLTATKAGKDTFVAYADLDADGSPDAGEPQTTATVDWKTLATGHVTEYSSGLSSSMGPTSIITAPDGTMWFTGLSGRLGRITTAGAITEYGWARTTPTRPLRAITWGPDGLIYVTESNTADGGLATGSGTILRVDPANPAAEPVVVLDLSDNAKVPAPCNTNTVDREPAGILAAFGFVWFTLDNCAAVGRIAPAMPGSATYATGVPTPVNRGYRGLAVGPDATSLYIGVARSSTAGTFARIANPQGDPPSVTESLLPGSPTPTDKTFSVVTGPDGNVWFTGVNAIYRIVPTDPAQNRKFGGVSTSFSDGPQSIIRGPDDNLWIADRNGGDITRVADLGSEPPTITPFPIPGSTTQGLTAGADGHIWFTQQGSNSIGRMFVAR